MNLSKDKILARTIEAILLDIRIDLWFRRQKEWIRGGQPIWRNRRAPKMKINLSLGIVMKASIGWQPKGKAIPKAENKWKFEQPIPQSSLNN